MPDQDSQGEHMEYYVSIDIGGTSIKYGILTVDGEILEKSSIDTEASKGGSALKRKVFRIIQQYQERYLLSGVCISTAGMVDCEKGEVFFAGALIPEYQGTKWKESIEKEFSLPCEVENDVNCAGLAEYKTGAARKSRVAVCLTVGTGIGGCALIDGKVFHGYSSCAMEIGYMYAGEEDFQTLGAASILSRKTAERKGDPIEAWNGIRVFEAAKAGDGICRNAIDEMCDVLGRGIADICYVLNPEVVVLGGGIMAQKEYLRPRLEAALAAYLKPVICAHTRLEFAYHQNDAGMRGAFYHFMDRQKAGK